MADPSNQPPDLPIAWELRGLRALFPPDFHPRAVLEITHGNGTLLVSATATMLREAAAILTSAAARLDTLQ